MISPKAKRRAAVPVMDKVGPLRQSTQLETGKTYWMCSPTRETWSSR